MQSAAQRTYCSTFVKPRSWAVDFRRKEAKTLTPVYNNGGEVEQVISLNFLGIIIKKQPVMVITHLHRMNKMPKRLHFLSKLKKVKFPCEVLTRDLTRYLDSSSKNLNLTWTLKKWVVSISVLGRHGSEFINLCLWPPRQTGPSMKG